MIIGWTDKPKPKIRVRLKRYKPPPGKPPFFCIACDQERPGWMHREEDHPSVCSACSFPDHGHKFSSGMYGGGWKDKVGGLVDTSALNSARAILRRIEKETHGKIRQAP